ncbi:MAG: hypothetical protein PHE25_02040 [Candidatus Gracilibacteria bacterium]|nr:hypothetical protein [Candidatus Gracilibacteria bacterium]
MNNSKKLIVSILLTTALATGITFAATGTGSGALNTLKHGFEKYNQDEWFLDGMRGGFLMQDNLTDAEKTALETMTSDDKRAFFEKKITDEQAKKEAQETVIDKLLAGTTLTADEEIIRTEIIKQRAERKAEMEARKKEIASIKTIIEKKRAGTILTTDEQATFDKFQADMPRGKIGEEILGKKGKMGEKGRHKNCKTSTGATSSGSESL